MIPHMMRVSISQSTITNAQLIAIADAAAARSRRQDQLRAAAQSLDLLRGTPPYP